MQRPLQWIVCLLHENELPFRHLFEKIDGKTTGPDSYSGPIGKQISGKDGLKLEPLENSKNFKPIRGKVPKIYYALENNDLKYFYRLCHLVQDGPEKGDLKILNEKPGKVITSRWITTASNILRLYCQTKIPFPFPNARKSTRPPKHVINYIRLKRLVRIILNLYAPMCFKIRKDHHVSNGSRLLFDQLKLARENLLPCDMEVFKDVFKNNCYFAHSEALLLSMLFDSRLEIRSKAVGYIVEARKRSKKYKKLRKYKLPKQYLNFDASEYHELLNWNQMKPREISDPPLLKKFTDDELKQFSKGQIQLEIGKIPCHSQAVERFVAHTSRAASNEIGYEKRHSNILNKQKSFQKFKSKFNKKHFASQ